MGYPSKIVKCWKDLNTISTLPQHTMVTYRINNISKRDDLKNFVIDELKIRNLIENKHLNFDGDKLCISDVPYASPDYYTFISFASGVFEGLKDAHENDTFKLNILRSIPEKMEYGNGCLDSADVGDFLRGYMKGTEYQGPKVTTKKLEDRLF